jgi:hypothetical protein
MMSNQKPSRGEYRRWLREKHGFDVSASEQGYYEDVVAKILARLQQSQFWRGLVDALREYDSQYQLATGYHLLIERSEPELKTKPFDSFLDKTYRKNIQDNKNWPNPPQSGWILPADWFSKINDILRTLFVVKYLDGVEFLAERISSCCMDCGLPCRAFYEAREDGYYAAHLYTEQEYEVPRRTWDTEAVTVSLEMQITTQLQEVIRAVLHGYYEPGRMTPKKAGASWQWGYRTQQFRANYLGHILHYLEGMIVEVREKQREGVR